MICSVYKSSFVTILWPLMLFLISVFTLINNLIGFGLLILLGAFLSLRLLGKVIVNDSGIIFKYYFRESKDITWNRIEKICETKIDGYYDFKIEFVDKDYFKFSTAFFKKPDELRSQIWELFNKNKLN